MIGYRKSFEVVGYTGDADVWCLDCAARAYGPRVLIFDVVVTDGEGNDVHPIFLDDVSSDGQLVCGRCFGSIS